MKLRRHRAELAARVQMLARGTQVLLLLIVAGYGAVQIAEGSHYRRLADDNRLRKLSIEASRGLILDRESRPLVENAPSYSLWIDRSRSAGLQDSLHFAADILGSTTERLEDLLEAHRTSPKFRAIRLADDLTLAQASRFLAQNWEHPEFEVQVDQLRLYRYAHQTAHLLGYLGEIGPAELEQPDSPYRPGDLAGRKGAEKLYERTLRGFDGEQVVVVDSRGQRIEELDTVPATAGRDIVLSLDLDLQQEAARLLEDRVGTIVALDPRDGSVLAMVSSPSFDPNLFARRLRLEDWNALVGNPDDPLQNRAIQNTYPPGSVFKIVMAVAGLEEGHADHDHKVFCGGFSKIYGHRYRCWKRGGHGWVNLREAMKQSCNVYFHQLGQKLGIDKIADYSRRFGLGSPSGFELGGENRGLVPDSGWSTRARGQPWYPGETISVATGQGPILTSPLQLAVMLSAVANGGRLPTPKLRLDASPKSRSVEVSEASLAWTREALWAVVNDRGTGKEALVPGLDVGGKTGTAQVVRQETWTSNEDLAEKNRDHAWFASFAPLEDPQLVVVVFVEHGGGGSTAAAPLAKAIYEKHFAELLEADTTPRDAS
ncbi:MAG: penicillin-binding protein 2 [Acidobacteriota bacterium]